MRVNDLLPLLDREADSLESENWGCAAALTRAAAEKMRQLAQLLREAGIDPDTGARR